MPAEEFVVPLLRRIAVPAVLLAAVGAAALAPPSAAALAPPSAAAAATAQVAPSAAVGSGRAAATSPQAVATAAAQVAWLLDVSRRLPVSAAEATAHLSPEFLAAVGGVAGFTATLRQVAGPAGLQRTRDVEVTATSAQVVVAGAAPLLVQLGTAPDGRISSLLFVPWSPTPTTTAEAARRLAAVAPQTSVLVARVDGGRCVPVFAARADTARPLGSAVKLWVLGAVAQAVRDGRTSWTEQLPIRADRISLPSGTFQTLPVGTRLPVTDYADAMISISDNTATDHLIGRIGRPAVERQFTAFGMARPDRNTPLLTTRDLFVLKGSPSAAAWQQAYRLLDPAGRRVLLERVLPLVPVASVTPWTTPVAVDQVEWFGSPADVCRAFAGLARQAADPALAPVGEALSINDGGIGVARRTLPTVWFKGGSEPGVLTLNHLVRDARGRVFVSSVMAADPAKPLPAAATAELTAIARAGLLAAAGLPLVR